MRQRGPVCPLVLGAAHHEIHGVPGVVDRRGGYVILLEGGIGPVHFGKEIHFAFANEDQLLQRVLRTGAGIAVLRLYRQGQKDGQRQQKNPETSEEHICFLLWMTMCARNYKRPPFSESAGAASAGCAARAFFFFVLWAMTSAAMAAAAHPQMIR